MTNKNTHHLGDFRLRRLPRAHAYHTSKHKPHSPHTTPHSTHDTPSAPIHHRQMKRGFLSSAGSDPPLNRMPPSLKSVSISTPLLHQTTKQRVEPTGSRRLGAHAKKTSERLRSPDRLLSLSLFSPNQPNLRGTPTTRNTTRDKMT